MSSGSSSGPSFPSLGLGSGNGKGNPSPPPPPPLRLRPRARENEPVASPAPGPIAPPSPDAASAPTAEEGVKRFRLKPKLSFDPDAQKTAAAPEETQPEPPVTKPLAAAPIPPMPEIAPGDALPVVPPVAPPVDPVSVPTLADMEGDGMPRLKLKAVSAETAATAPETPAPTSGLEVSGLPVSVPLPPPPSSLPPPPAGGIPRPGATRPPMPIRPMVPIPAPRKPARKKRGLLIAGMVVLPLLGCGIAYWFLGRSEPEPTPAPIVRQRVAVAPQIDPALLEELPASPNAGLGRPVDGAQGVPDMPAVGTAPGPVVPKGPSAAATKAFRTWVDGVQVSGVVSGSSPRAIINGRLVKMGDLVDSSQGIIFDGVDAERKELVFRTNTGLIGGKAY